MGKRDYDAHPFSDGPSTAPDSTSMSTPDAQPAPTSSIANVVECEYIVYNAFREHFNVMQVKRDYSGTHVYIPTAGGQIVKVSVDVLREDDASKFRDGTL